MLRPRSDSHPPSGSLRILFDRLGPRGRSSKHGIPRIDWLVLIALLATIVSSGHAEDAREPFSARCTGIIDGDTIEVVAGTQSQRVRLEGIDAPEAGQAFSSRAKQHLATLAFEAVSVKPRGSDRWGRLIARVSVDGEDLSEAMVEAGYAWHFERYSTDPVLAELEAQARGAARGLWVETRPMAPWHYRESQRLLATRPSDESDGPYHGNVSSGVFHAAHCQYYRCKNCTRVFETRQAAIDAGFRPCGICHP